MTEEQARALCQRREAEQPQFGWIVQQRGHGDWVVVRVPGSRPIDRGSLKTHEGPAVDVGDDPRPPSVRNIPPYGPAF